jgi:non-specific serine/threonine protein kinase
VIDWSIDLCSAAEQLLWARLSVFSRDFDVEATEAICSGAGLAREDVLDALTGLLDKSVLTTGGSAERMRYRLSETLREYGRDRLANSPDHRTCDGATASTTGTSRHGHSRHGSALASRR